MRPAPAFPGGMPLEPLLPLFHRLDREWFDGSLAPAGQRLVDLRWSDGRMRRTAGLYRRGRHPDGRPLCEIVLSRPLLDPLPQEATLSTLPEKPEHGSAEPTETCAHECDRGTVKELATRYTDGFRIWWRPWRDSNTLRHGKCSAATGYRLALELFAAHSALGFLVSRACLARQHASGFTATRCSKHDNTSEHDESSEGDDKCGVHDLQLEEDSVAPRKGEVVARTAEERANDGEYCPEH